MKVHVSIPKICSYTRMHDFVWNAWKTHDFMLDKICSIIAVVYSCQSFCKHVSQKWKVISEREEGGKSVLIYMTYCAMTVERRWLLLLPPFGNKECTLLSYFSSGLPVYRAVNLRLFLKLSPLFCDSIACHQHLYSCNVVARIQKKINRCTIFSRTA